ncbi:hypothetical protein DSM106972_099460 [Dulcicalothrix desertica PCC 7102]|uniref:Uncharacterized protein n=1 Tax=Dulcicalothrix desertica PCC 7102 TaxID=232991 RepID=A0A433UES8_9CYAN|nr:hypothetical protein [Dulcicalothrix desertica]RUS92345.1 hypothetical protein DSM106972_099460 [Dulcicalothrix desertica PCC 7102]TWH61462.1 hypothetical protein CAL7102_01030 [Dulcicalothrix desertica PCC 7102]
MSSPLLPINNMDARHRGLLPSTAANYLDAARVCLDRHHTPPQEFTLIDDNNESLALVDWKITSERDKNAWANQDDATRDAAYAFALATTELLRGLVAVRRAETRTGADYYIAPIGQEVEDLEGCFRLEVSGTNLGVSEIKRRLREKVDQALQGDSNLPALACVVGFRVKLIMIQTVEP